MELADIAQLCPNFESMFAYGSNLGGNKALKAILSDCKHFRALRLSNCYNIRARYSTHTAQTIRFSLPLHVRVQFQLLFSFV